MDDLNPTGYAQVVEETVNGAPQRTYTYGLQRISENQIVNNTWTPSFYEYDGMGSVRQLTDSAGAVTDTYEYDAFGNEINHTGTTPNEMLYRGEQWDSDLGLYYLRARWYDPITGRFVARDPNKGVTTDPKTLHKYLYADGDPVNGMDPTGRDDLIEVGNLDEELSTAENKQLEEVGQRLECDFETDASVLGDVISPAGETLVELIPAPEECKVKAIRERCGTFPDNPQEMNDILGVEGTPKPDTPLTPGRNKWVWNLGKIVITFEQHPYDVGSPAWHSGPHWHVDWPGTRHKRFSPGDKFPGCP